jgi:hypothetical protein
MESAPASMLAWRRALHFAPDSSLDPSWFSSYEESRYEGENSIDLVEIDRRDGSYDYLILSLVLEFVKDDRRAFDELVRIGSESAIMQFTFGSTMTAPRSTHFDEPYGPYGRFHDYGRDIGEWFGFERHGISPLVVRGADPVTGFEEPFFFFCRSNGAARTLAAAFAAAESISGVELLGSGPWDPPPAAG